MKENMIKERFDAARKIYGATDEIITASGVKVRGISNGCKREHYQ